MSKVDLLKQMSKADLLEGISPDLLNSSKSSLNALIDNLKNTELSNDVLLDTINQLISFSEKDKVNISVLVTLGTVAALSELILRNPDSLVMSYAISLQTLLSLFHADELDDTALDYTLFSLTNLLPSSDDNVLLNSIKELTTIYLKKPPLTFRFTYELLKYLRKILETAQLVVDEQNAYLKERDDLREQGHSSTLRTKTRSRAEKRAFDRSELFISVFCGKQYPVLEELLPLLKQFVNTPRYDENVKTTAQEILDLLDQIAVVFRRKLNAVIPEDFDYGLLDMTDKQLLAVVEDMEEKEDIMQFIGTCRQTYDLIEHPAFEKAIQHLFHDEPFTEEESTENLRQLNALPANTEKEVMDLVERGWLEILLNMCKPNDDTDGGVTLSALEILVLIGVNMPFQNAEIDGKRISTAMDALDGYLRLIRLFYRVSKPVTREKIAIVEACFSVWKPMHRWVRIVIPLLKEMLYTAYATYADDAEKSGEELVAGSDGVALRQAIDTLTPSLQAVGSGTKSSKTRDPTVPFSLTAAFLLHAKRRTPLDDTLDAFNRMSFDETNENVLINNNVVPHYLHHPLFQSEDPYFVRTTVTLLYNLSFTDSFEMKGKMIRGGVFSAFYVFLNLSSPVASILAETSNVNAEGTVTAISTSNAVAVVAAARGFGTVPKSPIYTPYHPVASSGSGTHIPVYTASGYAPEGRESVLMQNSRSRTHRRELDGGLNSSGTKKRKHTHTHKRTHSTTSSKNEGVVGSASTRALPTTPAVGSASKASLAKERTLPPARKEVSITVINGKVHRKHEILGQDDPFVKIVIGGAAKQTRTINNNMEPTWNEVISFSGVTADVAEISILDEDIVGPPCLIGTATISLRDYVNKKKHVSLSLALKNIEEAKVELDITVSAPAGSTASLLSEGGKAEKLGALLREAEQQDRATAARGRGTTGTGTTTKKKQLKGGKTTITTITTTRRSKNNSVRGLSPPSHGTYTIAGPSSPTGAADYELIRSVCAAIKRLTNRNAFAVKTVLDLSVITPLMQVLQVIINTSPPDFPALTTAPIGLNSAPYLRSLSPSYGPATVGSPPTNTLVLAATSASVQSSGAVGSGFGGAGTFSSSGRARADLDGEVSVAVTAAEKALQDKRETVRNIIAILANCAQYEDHSKEFVEGSVIPTSASVLKVLLTLPLKDVNKYFLLKVVRVHHHIAGCGYQRSRGRQKNKFAQLYMDHDATNFLAKLFYKITAFVTVPVTSGGAGIVGGLSSFAPFASQSIPYTSTSTSFSTPTTDKFPNAGLELSMTGAGSSSSSQHQASAAQTTQSRWEEIRLRVALAYCYLLKGDTPPEKYMDIAYYVHNRLLTAQASPALLPNVTQRNRQVDVSSLPYIEKIGAIPLSPTTSRVNSRANSPRPDGESPAPFGAKSFSPERNTPGNTYGSGTFGTSSSPSNSRTMSTGTGMSGPGNPNPTGSGTAQLSDYTIALYSEDLPGGLVFVPPLVSGNALLSDAEWHIQLAAAWEGLDGVENRFAVAERDRKSRRLALAEDEQRRLAELNAANASLNETTPVHDSTLGPSSSSDAPPPFSIYEEEEKLREYEESEAAKSAAAQIAAAAAVAAAAAAKGRKGKGKKEREEEEEEPESGTVKEVKEAFETIIADKDNALSSLSSQLRDLEGQLGGLGDDGNDDEEKEELEQKINALLAKAQALEADKARLQQEVEAEKRANEQLKKQTGLEDDDARWRAMMEEVERLKADNENLLREKQEVDGLTDLLEQQVAKRRAELDTEDEGDEEDEEDDEEEER